MYVAMECKCGGSISIDSEWEESCWLMSFRFSEAHVKCGTFTDNSEMPVRPAYLDDDEDEPDVEGEEQPAE